MLAASHRRVRIQASANHFRKHLLSAASRTSAMAGGKAGLCSVAFAVLLIFFFGAAAGADDGSIDQQCATEASKLTECVGYASGEEATPTSQCCGSVSEVRGKDPTCLCLVIRRAHDGGGGVSGLHLRLDRLLSLPKACALANSSVSYCPKLLNLSPSSPDYAIFTNASYANPASTVSATTNSTSTAAKTLSNFTIRLIAAAAAVAFFLVFQIRA
ncbi:hypothetical protein KSP39_PZI022142 [Platanthera zijinensis]|uniref:Bifunctional inhibitor/plant lipid transfer protein/seed storage helical domain-containing protein n=1 Tax=Platanthera zijinensis TaxID=2320716 RepID=A0AAP0FWM9_9ASPA